MSISAGINTESKTKMKELIERKQTEATYIRKKIAEYATAIQQEIDTLTPFWLNSYLDKMQREHVELVRLETQIELLEVYAAPNEE